MELRKNKFSSYELSELEILSGTILTHTQLAVLQNKLADIATAKLNIQFDGVNITKFAQAEAYERGQMDAIQWLIDSSEAAFTAAREAEQQANNS